jgi:hypothetical protein
MEIMIGETQGRITSAIEEGLEPRILLRTNWRNTKMSKEVGFKLDDGLKRGEQVKITVEKIYSAPPAADKK